MNDDASGALPMIACHECGTVQRMRALPEGGAARCAPLRRDAYRERRDSIEHTLLLTLAALILFVVANAFPILTFELEGKRTQHDPRQRQGLYDDGMWPLALAVPWPRRVVPLAKILGMLASCCRCSSAAAALDRRRSSAGSSGCSPGR